jgi:hypothetical protein
LLHVGQRPAADQVHIQLLKTAACQVRVSIVEAWHGEPMLKINDLRLLTLQLFDVNSCAHCHNLSARNGDRIGPPGSFRGARVRSGINVTVDENDVSCF